MFTLRMGKDPMDTEGKYSLSSYGYLLFATEVCKDSWLVCKRLKLK